LTTRRREFASRGQDSWPEQPACIDRIVHCGVAINAGVAEVAHGRKATLQIFVCHLRTQ
jgi:hypothetical protein